MSMAARLVPVLGAALLWAATPGLVDAYVRPGRTERVSVSSQGREGNRPAGAFAGNVYTSDVSPDGRFVVFPSDNDGLVKNDTNLATDIFLHDRMTGLTERVSVAWDGSQALCKPRLSGFADRCADVPSVSADGRYVAFASDAPNLVKDDTNLVTDVFVRDRKKGVTERISVSSQGEQAVCLVSSTCSTGPSISADGRYVSFSSDADNLVNGDSREDPVNILFGGGLDLDIFLHDRKKDTTSRVTEPALGDDSNGDSFCSAISGNGRFVTFASQASNLIALDTNQLSDVFVYDRVADRMTIASVASDGTQTGPPVIGTSDSCMSADHTDAISSDGRFVAFYSGSGDLVPTDSNIGPDVFVHDTETRRTERVSVGSDGRELNLPGIPSLSISPDGRYIAFSTRANTEDHSGEDLPAGVYVYDRATGSLQPPWRGPSFGKESPTCAPSNPFSSHWPLHPSISARGRYVSFSSCRATFVPGDRNDAWDVFVRDRGLALGGEVDPIRSSVASASTHSASSSGLPSAGFVRRTDPVGDATGIGASPSTDVTSGTIALRPRTDDLFVAIDVVRLVGLRGAPARLAGHAASHYGVDFAIGSRRYRVGVSPWHADPARGATFRLFRCRRGCVPVADLAGGLGTAGERIVVSIPLRSLDWRSHARLGGVVVFAGTGVGSAAEVNDTLEIRLP